MLLDFLFQGDQVASFFCPSLIALSSPFLRATPAAGVLSSPPGVWPLRVPGGVSEEHWGCPCHGRCYDSTAFRPLPRGQGLL